MQKLFFILSCFMAAALPSGAQSKPITITGKIVSADRSPVSGASVSLKIQQTQTVSGEDGSFSISSNGHKDSLIVSHTGFFEKSVSTDAATGSPLIIVLEINITQLQTVTVSTGLQTIPKERATGSFTLIENKLYNEQAGPNALNRLQYISNGYAAFPLRNTGDNLFLVRGLSTFSVGLAKPLVIVDNFEYAGDVNNINPNDVENVTFLKDAAAGSIWGAKAANGVIVITTKKGRYNQPVKVEVNANTSITEKPELLYSKSISSTDFIDMEKFLFDKGFYNSSLSLPQFYVLSPVVNLLDREKRGIISPADADAQINALRNNDVRNEYAKYFYQKAVSNQYAVSVSGGSSTISWIASAGFDKNAGVLDDRYERFNMRFDNVYAPFKNFEISTSFYYTQSNTTAGRPSYGSISTLSGAIPPYTSFADTHGNPTPVYTLYNSSYIDTLGNGRLPDWHYYPLNDYKYISNKTSAENMNAVIGLRYKLFSSLTIDVKYRYQKQSTENNYLYGQQSFYARDLVNSYSQPGASPVIYKVPKGDILDKTNGGIKAQNLRVQLNYVKAWKKNSIVSLAGAEISETVNESNSYRTYGYNGDILTYVNVDYANMYPNLIYGSAAFIPNNVSFSKTNTRFVSFYLNGAYTYNNKYTASISARRDASNIRSENQ